MDFWEEWLERLLRFGFGVVFCWVLFVFFYDYEGVVESYMLFLVVFLLVVLELGDLERSLGFGLFFFFLEKEEYF